MEGMQNVPQVGSEIKYNDKGDFFFHCDTTGFKPEEISVHVEGQTLTISGKHSENNANESVERQFN
jgi:HSP20 family molecular chaperone IbpA